jgi:hypothetical protein
LKDSLFVLGCVLALISPTTSRAQAIPGAIIYSVNATTDAQIGAFNASHPYDPNDIVVNSYTADHLVPLYELLIQGVASIQNPGTQDATVDIIVVNASPLCGWPYGVAPYGPGRVLTVTVPAGHIVAVPISVIDFIGSGASSSAHLQYRHATGPLVAKANSYLDVIMIAATSTGVSNTPNEGLPFQPGNCP